MELILFLIWLTLMWLCTRIFYLQYAILMAAGFDKEQWEKYQKENNLGKVAK